MMKGSPRGFLRRPLKSEAQMKHPASCTPELLEALESRRVRRPTDEL